ncbi:hypothetical protein Pmani_026523, partial [Petrolisthes manimaculis]
RRARRLVVVAWLLSAVFASPCLLFFMEASVDGVVQCWIDFPEAWQWKLYMTVVSLTIFLFPTFIITACYAIIVYTIWSKNGERRVCGGEEDSRRASSRGLIPKAKIKTVKMTLVIVLGKTSSLLTPTNVAVATLIQSLAPLNSAANPVIYCLFSTPICRNIRQKWSTTKSTFTISSKNPSAGLGGGGGSECSNFCDWPTLSLHLHRHRRHIGLPQVLLVEGERNTQRQLPVPPTGTPSCPNQLRGEWEYTSEGKKRGVSGNDGKRVNMRDQKTGKT